jgi:hypothetical protein
MPVQSAGVQPTSTEAEYDELWRSIRESPLSLIYLSELYWLARDIVDRTKHLFSEAGARVYGSNLVAFYDAV